MIRHHLTDALAADYAAGNLGEAGRLWVASHLAMCESCRGDLLAWEAVGGALLEATAPGATEAVPESIWARIDGPEPTRPPAIAGDPSLPEPLRSVMGRRNTWSWRPAWLGIWHTRVPVGPEGTRLRIYEFKPKVTVPRHDHPEPERTLILRGSCHDENGRYEAGDVLLVEHGSHSLQIEDQGCAALQWNLGPIRPESRALAALNRVMRV